MIKKNIKLLIGIIIGGIVFGSIGVYGAGKLYASSIDVDTSKMSELGETSNVNLALNYLYGKAATLSSNGPTIYPSGYQGVGAEIYLDPTDLTKKCDTSNVVSGTGRKSGCMRWYVYSSTPDKYIAILDHNTTATISSWSNRTSQLNTDTNSWKKGTNQLMVRLITAQEVAFVTGNGSWVDDSKAPNPHYLDTGTSSRNFAIDSAGESRYSWLFDYTNNCTSYGCSVADSSAEYYWTDTACIAPYLTDYAWVITFDGTMQRYSKSSTSYGIRPVIEIPKSIFN